MPDLKVRVMLTSGGEAGIMVMSAPTDRLQQGITMNHTASRSESIALSYGGKGERPSWPRVASQPALGDSAGRRLRIHPRNSIINHISKCPHFTEEQNVLRTLACLSLPSEAIAEKVHSGQAT